MFSEFKVRDWKSFNEDASRILTGRANRRLSKEQVFMMKAIPALVLEKDRASDEADLFDPLQNSVFSSANILFKPDPTSWKHQPKNTQEPCELRTPDFSLTKNSAGSSSNQRRDNPPFPLVTGELKSSCLKLESSLSAASVTDLIRHPEFYKLEKAKPFFQLFSCMLYTTKGVGVLTNLDETRFFKINQKDKELLMSPLVRIDQRLVKSEKERVPHVVQAYMYADEIPDPTADELSSRTTVRLLDEAHKKAKEMEKRREEEKAKKKSSGSDKKKSGAGASSYEIFSPASNILEKCRVIGAVGEGLTGHVTECDSEGLKVAVKTGLSDYRDERDCFVHVQNEIDMYDMLKELQGSVVPRVLAGCLERYYTPSAMVLITEKVGMAVVMKDDKLFVGDKELSREDLGL